LILSCIFFFTGILLPSLLKKLGLKKIFAVTIVLTGILMLVFHGYGDTIILSNPEIASYEVVKTERVGLTFFLGSIIGIGFLVFCSGKEVKI